MNEVFTSVLLSGIWWEGGWYRLLLEGLPLNDLATVALALSPISEGFQNHVTPDITQIPLNMD